MKLGIIGLNEGNGHPYSYAAIFNGYDPDALIKECPFALIKDYLPKEHQNKFEIKEAKVTHIWTQDKNISESISRVSLIPNIVGNYEDLIGKVDGVILARDDIENHYTFARPFIERGIPIFIDKQLAHTKDDLKKIKMLCKTPQYPLMACSAIRYNPTINQFLKNNSVPNTISIQGISRVNWLRYAHHLFEGITLLYGRDVTSVRYLGISEEHEIYLVKYQNNLTVILEFDINVQLPIRFNVHSSDSPHLEFCFDDFFKSFKLMLQDFVKVVETNSPVISHDEMFSIADIILAGIISKEKNGIEVNPQLIWRD